MNLARNNGAKMSESDFSTLAMRSQSVIPAAEMQHFLDSFLYEEEAVLVDEITSLDHENKRIEAILDTNRPLPLSARQRVSSHHLAHVSGPELIMATGSLGGMHPYFFHGCRWEQGWAGFGNRIHRADFKRLALIGPPIMLESVETRSRIGPTRIVLRYAFSFRQNGELIYVGDQSAMFVKNRDL
jgi:hypothetical protein